MARYIQDQNKVVFQIESGLYTSTSGPGIWIGQVTENTIDDTQNPIMTRFLGTATRNYDTMDQGPEDFTSTLTYNPQDMNLVFWAIGSVADVSGPQSQHVVTEINSDIRQNAFTSGTLNPPKSWTIEDSKQSPGTGANFIRTLQGAIPNVTTITATQGERVTVGVDFVAATMIYGSGATTALVEETSPTYLWSDTQVTVAGSILTTIKETSLEINQNMEPPHYLNGSRQISVPFVGDREYTFNLTMDLNHPEAKRHYDTFYRNLGSFNVIFELNANDRGQVGSQHAIFTMSGCRVTSMDIPSLNDGVTEVTVEIKPETLSATDFTNGTARALYAEF